MKNKGKYIVVIIIVILSVGGFIGYKYYSKNEIVNNFKNYVQTYKEKIKDYNLDSEEKNRYNELMTKADVAINLKSKDYILNLQNDFRIFYKNVKEANVKSINEEFKKVKELNVSNLDKKIQSKISNMENEIEVDIRNSKFSNAKKKINDINNLINKEKLEIKRKDEKDKLKENSFNKNSNVKKEDSNSKDLSYESAKKLVMQADGDYINKYKKDGFNLNKLYESNPKEANYIGKPWNIKGEDFIAFSLDNDEIGAGGYLVGKESKNVYRIPNQGCMPAFLIKYNKIVKRYEYVQKCN